MSTGSTRLTAWRASLLAVPVALLAMSCGNLNGGSIPGPNLSMDVPPAATSESWESPFKKTKGVCLSSLPAAMGRLTWGHHVILEPGLPGWRELQPALPMPICAAGVAMTQSTESDDTRDSTDSARAILDSILISIARVHGIVGAAAVDSTGRTMPPVNVDFFPVYEDTRHKPHRFVTDNATYDRHTGTITLFPSRSMDGPHAKIWRSPFIHAHEIAHHAIKFLSDENPDPSTEEALADAIAFLATGGNPALIQELPGFGVDRDPTMPWFSDGTSKASWTGTGRGWRDAHRDGAAKAFRILRELPDADHQTKLRLVMAKFLSREI